MRRRTALLAGVALLGGCAGRPDLNRPMEQLSDAFAAGAESRHLIVFLPGARDVPEDFFRFGFVAAVRTSGLAADIVAVGATIAHFDEQSIAERLRDEIVEPARRRGYRGIWLVGISLGGLGAMLCAAMYGGIDGIVALAPYVGTREAIAQVRRAGGLRDWRPDDSGATNAWERRLLGWLQRHGTPDAPTTELVLAYGRQDRFADSLGLVGRVLEPSRVLVADGGHDWDTWRALWQQVLERHGARIAPRAG